MTNSLKCHGTAQHCNESSLPSWLEASKLRLPEANPRRSPPGRLAKDRVHVGQHWWAQTQREEQLRLRTANQGSAPHPPPPGPPNHTCSKPRGRRIVRPMLSVSSYIPNAAALTSRHYISPRPPDGCREVEGYYQNNKCRGHNDLQVGRVRNRPNYLD